jgi:hypothetical protein
MKTEVGGMRKALYITVLAIALALVFSLSGGISAWFAARISLPLSSLLSAAAAAAPWPVAEGAFVVGAPLILALFLIAAVRHRPPKGAALALSAILLAYTILWVPLTRVPAQQSAPYEAWRLMKLCQTLGDQAQQLRGKATPSETLLEDARDAVASLNLSNRTLHTPKFSRFPRVLGKLKIAGIYSPWTGETILSPTEPDFSLPFLAAHELAHAAGVAREDEANFAAYRACMAGDEGFQYAGTIYSLRYAMDALRGINLDKWFEIRRGLSDGVRGDLARISDPGEVQSGFAALADRTAEVFLQLSGQPAGLSSYTGMVNFLLSDVALVDHAQTLQSEDAVQYVD